MDNMFRDLRAYQKQKEIAVKALKQIANDIANKALKEIEKLERKM